MSLRILTYAAYGKHRGKLVPFFEAHGYELEKRAAMISGGTRMIFFSANIPMIDVFFDKLDYNHPIDYRGRLEAHPNCVSLADLMLQKLQIVQINDKDLKDAMLLLLAAQLGDTDKDAINAKYIAKLFSDDWGFYHTATTNLKRIKEACQRVKALTDEQRDVIAAKVDDTCSRSSKMPPSPASGKAAPRRVQASPGTRKSRIGLRIKEWEIIMVQNN